MACAASSGPEWGRSKTGKSAMRALAMILAVAAAVAVTCPAQAQERGFYVGGEVGLVASSGMDMVFTPGGSAGTNGQLETDHDLGFSGSAFAGYDFGWIRLEAEASQLGADVDKANSDWSHAGGLVVGSQSVDGDVRARSTLLNVLVDFGPAEGVSFFVGGGAGKSTVRVSALALPDGGSELLDHDDRKSSWQAIAGVRKSVSEHLELHVRYRYFKVDDLEMVGLAGRAVSSELTSHAVTVGLAYRF